MFSSFEFCLAEQFLHRSDYHVYCHKNLHKSCSLTKVFCIISLLLLLAAR